MSTSDDTAAERPSLQYEASTTGVRSHGVCSLVGLALSVTAAAIAIKLWWGVWRAVAAGGTAVKVFVGEMYYVLPVVALVLCAVGAARGRRAVALTGVVIAAAALVAIITVVYGSPWS